LLDDSATQEAARIALQTMARHGRLRESGDLARAAIARYPSDASMVHAYALWLEYQGNFDVALAYWRRLERLAPSADPHHLNLARALLYANDLDAALALLTPLLERRGGEGDHEVALAHAIAGEALLKAGDPAGFAHYLYRIWANAGFYEVPDLPGWNGEELAGKRLLVTHHLGYGDQLLCASLLPALADRGATVAVTTDYAISSLMQHALPQITVFTGTRACTPHQPPDADLREIVARFRPDYQTTFLHLPHHAAQAEHARAAFFPPYLSAPQPAVRAVAVTMDAVRATAAGRQVIGIAWDCIQRHYGSEQGEYVASFSERRSISTEAIALLIDDPEVRAAYHFIALHPQTHFDAIATPLPQNLSLPAPLLRRFSETAAVIERCDAVLSIDMSIANLAALMGKELTLMLQHEGEWRFGIAGERSPWFAEPLCLRQTIPGDWTPVLAGVRAHLLMKALGVCVSAY
jgi:tetratricopeptide (TPR) repeat protein